MPKAIMVLADGRSYTAVDGCRVLLCPDNVQDQQIQQVLQQLQQGNMQAIQSGQFKVATRFGETQGQQAWQQILGASAQSNQAVAVIDQHSFLLATQLDPTSSLSQTQGSPQNQQYQQNPYQQSIQGQGFAQSSQSSQQQRPNW